MVLPPFEVQVGAGSYFPGLASAQLAGTMLSVYQPSTRRGRKERTRTYSGVLDALSKTDTADERTQRYST
jgi:hypothetical protein